MSLLDMAISVPWLMDESALRGVLAFAARDFDSAKLIETRRGERIPGSRMTELRSGVAVLSITGPIVRHADLMTEFCGGATTAAVAREFTAALENPDVHAILLNLDSPGGEAAGIEELSSLIRDGRGVKPITAYVESQAASAAYWIASAADRIVIGKTAMVGSIGAIFTTRDTTVAKERAGIEDIQFVSSVSPKKRPDLHTDEGKATIQTLVDALGSAFVDSVAANRGVTRAKVLADFGQGGQLMGKAAVTAGLADQIGSFEKVLKGMISQRGKPQKVTASLTTQGPSPMTIRQQLAAFLGRAAQAEAEGKTSLDREDLTALLADPAPSPTAQDPDPEVATLKAALSQAEAKLKAVGEAESKSKADAHTLALDACAQAARDHVATLGDRLTPAAATLLEGVYTQAGIDDLAGGTRTASLREFLAALPTHDLLSETTLDEGDRVVPLTSDPDDGDDPVLQAAMRRYAAK